jgi:hypothetical protein
MAKYENRGKHPHLGLLNFEGFVHSTMCQYFVKHEETNG